MGTIEMAGNPAFGGAMARCEFCGTNVLPGVKLCSECRSALKRARNEPASVLQPLVKRAADTLERRDRRRAQRREARAAEARAAGLVPPPVEKSRLAPWFIGALLVAVAVVAASMWAFHGREGEAVPLSTPVATDAVAPPAASPSAASTAAPAPDAATAASAAMSPAATPAAASAATPAEPAGTVPPAHPAGAHAAPKARRTLRIELPKPEAAPQRIAAPAPMAPLAAAPRVPVVAAPPDRRSLLRDAFARCPQDEIVARAVCEQRARIEYCDGLWGSVPQCPAQRDYGG